ncbi:hypothetical protein [Microlunatus sp. Y2014]|uniref:hypothetical protein n=1 Tax=Microlunatus sp. Y2014 TaxID=3418488 RepID=UPI003DA74512
MEAFLIMLAIVLGVAGWFVGRSSGLAEGRRQQLLRDQFPPGATQLIGTADPGGLVLPEAARQQIEIALSAGRKIEAIKLYREATGRGLAEAKQAIDDWDRPRVIAAEKPSDPPPVEGDSAWPQLPPENRGSGG